MTLLKKLMISLFFISIISCSSIDNFSNAKIMEYEKKGYAVNLNSKLITFSLLYLDRANVKSVKKIKSAKTISIESKSDPSFYSIEDLKSMQRVTFPLKYITINGAVLDSLEIPKILLETTAIKYVRLLTQEDYNQPEFDSLPRVKESVGSGILIIETN